LLFSGAYHAWRTGRPLSGLEDQVLTAHEASQLNLSQTKLVVLSACETGLGDIRGHVGVFGLQRAFRKAGAKNLIMSLWSVRDDVTAVFFSHFYGNWLDKGMAIRDAFEETQRWMRGQSIYKSPYFWAGFVLVGEL
jgi:CHAT domain-containing protein